MAGPVVVVDAFDQEVGVPGDEGEVEGGHFEGKAGAVGGRLVGDLERERVGSGFWVGDGLGKGDEE